ncbi:MAG: zinc-dependent metalloprotease [Aquiluna sp.]|nr:zinc-dependent metalloprotease [Aquiluna sp.]MCF8546091.1 zinc-dependent metalloprotease [Aquiluna sp.]
MEENSNNEELEKLLREMMQSGAIDPEALAKAAGLNLSPASMAQAFSQFRSMMQSDGESVNWDLANKQASEIASKSQIEPSEAIQREIQTAMEMANLWLSEETGFISSQPPKHLTRKIWVADALPLYKELSEPIATSMAKALSENLGNLLPEQLSEMLGPATKFLGNAGATIFAMQLGQAVGKLSSEVLSSSEIGVPLSNRPGLLLQNISEFLKDLETPKSEVLIYLCIRELAMVSLFSSNNWLSEGLVSQIREFASGLKVDTSELENLAEGIDINNPDSIREMIQAGALISQRTPEQELALGRIETLLALSEGWADAVTFRAARRLPNQAAISEILRRRRVTQGAQEKTFALLLGLELKPRLLRESAQMWQRVFEALGTKAQDDLWSHPDQLPTPEEIQDPESLISRLQDSGDDFDQELRDLLG